MKMRTAIAVLLWLCLILALPWHLADSTVFQMRIKSNSTSTASVCSLFVYKNATLSSTARRLNVSVYDSSMAVSDTGDTFYQAQFVWHYAGTDSGATDTKDYGRGAVGGSWLLDQRWLGLTDSIRVRNYTDGALVGHVGFTAKQSYISPMAVTSGHLYQRDIEIWFNGSDAGANWVSERSTVASAGGSVICPTPTALPSTHWVTLYVYLGTPGVDSSLSFIVPKTKAELICELIGPHGMTADTVSLIPTEIRRRPDATGYVYFNVIANTKISPQGSYYNVYYRSRDGHTSAFGLLKKFVLDTVPDPINITATTEVP